MGILVNTKFDVYSDATGRDPDSHSATLRRYHQTLWSKPLPDGTFFNLATDRPGSYLYHSSKSGEFSLSSDSLGDTYRYVKAMAPVISEVPESELNSFFSMCSTVGGYIVFHARKIEGKITINAARGLHRKIRDRFDVSLECIRRHYVGEESPLSAVLERYADFFRLFRSFEGYVNFFLLQDLFLKDHASIRFFLPFEDFGSPPLPPDMPGYLTYRDGMVAFITARNSRIVDQTE